MAVFQLVHIMVPLLVYVIDVSPIWFRRDLSSIELEVRVLYGELVAKPFHGRRKEPWLIAIFILVCKR
jgi:hypothetical protein